MEDLRVIEIIERQGSQPSSLIAILQDVQAEYRYLPEEALALISGKLKVPVSRVYSLATFFKSFSLEPRGEHTINVCMGTACHVRGAGRILEKIERDMGIKTGGTTKDMKFGLDEVHCLGCCGLAPVVTVDDDLYGKVTLTKLPGILKKYSK